MTKLGRYVKAYPLERLRAYAQWAEFAREPADRPHLYLQENYTVTDGIFLDEGVVFDRVTPEWIAFCTERLEFAMPEWTVAETQERSP